MAEEIQAEGQIQMTTAEIDARIEKAKLLLSDAIDLLFPLLGEDMTIMKVSEAIEERLDYLIEEASVGFVAFPHSTMVH